MQSNTAEKATTKAEKAIKNKELVDKTYKLKGRKIPISYTLASRNTKRFPLLYFDEENNENRALRYARNQRTPFEDEQDGNAIVEPIVFENGFLHVPRTNPALQAFLYYHPQNGILFEEVNAAKDASAEIEKMNVEVDAMIAAKEMTIDMIEKMSRVLFNRDVARTESATLRRDIMVYARREPRKFMAALQDPMLELQSEIHLFFDKGLLSFKNNQKEVWYNTPSNKKKMLVVPFGEDPYSIVMMHLKTDDGLPALKMLRHHLGDK